MEIPDALIQKGLRPGACFSRLKGVGDTRCPDSKGIKTSKSILSSFAPFAILDALIQKGLRLTVMSMVSCSCEIPDALIQKGLRLLVAALEFGLQ